MRKTHTILTEGGYDYAVEILTDHMGLVGVDARPTDRTFGPSGHSPIVLAAADATAIYNAALAQPPGWFETHGDPALEAIGEHTQGFPAGYGLRGVKQVTLPA